MQTQYLRRALTLSILLLGLQASRVNAAGPATSISVAPNTATITADQTVVFTVTATDAGGNTTNVTADSTLSTNDPSGSVVGATYHAGKVGQWKVQVDYQSFTTSATVTVTPGALAEIDINPNSDPEIVSLGNSRTFRAQGYDQHDNVVTDFSPTWVVGGSIGTIDTNGKFVATTAGTGTVEARSPSGVIDQVAITVRDAVPSSTVNTNTSVNTNTTSTTNQNSNLNGTTNGNTNTVVNTNTTLQPSNTNTNTSTTPLSPTLKCTTMKNSLWVLMVIGYLALVALLFAFIPVTRIWPAVIALSGAIALIFIHRNYGCSILPWWPWVMTLGTVGLTMLALRQAPKKM